MNPSRSKVNNIQDLSQNIELLEAMETRLAVASQFLLTYERELISFISCLPYPAWIKDYHTRMIYVNPAYEKAYSVAVEDYNGKQDFEVWHNDFSNEYKTNDIQVMRTGKHVELKETFEDASSTIHTIDVLKWPLTNGGVVLGVAGMVTNNGKHNSIT